MWWCAEAVPAAWLAGEEQVRCANLKQISLRMKSVSSVAKITKAMKMVAAAKLRTVQTLQENALPFAVGMQEFFDVMDEVEEGAAAAVAADPSKSKSTLVVAITSDRGLCGGVNSAVVRETKKLIATAPKNVQHVLMLLGDKGRDGIARVHGDSIAVSFKDVFKAPVSFTQVCLIAEDILSRNFDEIVLVYNEFQNVMTQTGAARPPPAPCARLCPPCDIATRVPDSSVRFLLALARPQSSVARSSACSS
jgi:ATP synthase F1 gamma subunit